MSDKRKSFLSIFEDVASKEPLPLEEEGDYSLTDEIDHTILMHRDAHFGGDFQVMRTYYEEDRVGTQPEIDLARIDYLAEVERQTGQNLSATMLSGFEAEQVAQSRRAYEKLKEIYEIEEEESPFPRLLADLILSEEEEPQEEIEAIVAHGSYIVPELIQIIRSEEAYNPLFPGYGYAPYLAIECLAEIKDESALIPLFELLGRDIDFEEDVILDALRGIGEPAKQFLLEVIQGRPIAQDTVSAAFALTVFADQPDVAIACFKQLQDEAVRAHTLLRTYLLYNCEGLEGTTYQELLIKMAADTTLPADFRAEIEQIIHTWK